MSSSIDFMPPSYRAAQAQRSRWVWRAALVAVVAVGLVAASVALKARSAGQRRMAERLESTVDAEHGVLGLVNKLEKQRLNLLSRLELKRELSPSVTFSQVIASLGGAMPEGVTMRELVITTVRPRPEPLTDPSKKPVKTTRKGGEEPAPRQPHLIGVSLDALAPDDLAVATLISTLDKHPLFERVTLRSSRAIETQGVSARQFELTATIDLDREFEWTGQGQEVADADR